ncbi:TPA: hypothetical protein MB376_000431 [Klebsiella pneumoniae]|uniref:hypothetical protein n=1 Tax=Klebsiella pneumoniae TaxID=573 RepID=UPI0020412131|nr:hypothetical protein [Klebsiella pneumoniae]USB68593.1 hypothetical protein KU667_16145 [Klebsiella pneumoniae]HBT4852192.1 hypothetical protein [Klebsiella pneumoniae]HBT4871131.1 hypothetical protein [Klebsiella pneumoniae]HBT4882073.1 hypothetical protein [Klebsiella pneumoniae]HBT4887587.1 hypothetical protein [Klebsiella pneumoniae]
MAITTTLYYPADVLPGPLKDGFGMKPKSPVKITELVTGRKRIRRGYTSVPTETDVAWIFTDAQAQAFEAWYRDVLKDGSAWFNMPLLTPVGQKNYVCRFNDIYEGPTPVGGLYWRYSASLELWERPLPAVGWGEYPEWIVGSSLLDIALNREWPKHDSD